MPPFIDYTLSEDSYCRYVELLAEQNIRAKPTRRETQEVFDSSSVTYNTFGVLCQGALEFPYTLTWEGKQRTLTIEPFDHGVDAANEIMAAVERTFPQPVRAVMRQPEKEARSSFKSILEKCGCFLVLLIVLSFSILAAIGAVTTLRYIFA